MLHFLKNKKSRANLCSKIVDLSDSGIVVFDDFINVSLFNLGAENIFGYDREEILYQGADVLFAESDEFVEIIKAMRFSAEGLPFISSGDKIKYMTCVRKDGSEFMAEIKVLRVNGDFVMTINDAGEDKQDREQLLRMASTDPLTGVFNRREFTMLADRESQRVSRYERPLSLLFLDVDHLKKVNDTYGHEAGDWVLVRCAEICSDALRNVDVIGRWGGDEFAILLPETSAEGAMVIANRLRKLMEDAEIEFESKQVRFTVSIGVTEYRDVEKNIEEPLKRADQAMYKAKDDGRNRVVQSGK